MKYVATIGILLFDGAEEMDVVGPWEVFAAAIEGNAGQRLLTIAETSSAVTCEKGTRVIPSVTYADAPDLDVIIVPGGSGARREINNVQTLDWLTKTAAKCTWITSVCTGAFLLVGSGVANGRRVTTHHDFIAALRALDSAEVVEGVRFVRDGKFVTAGGVMSGIEMSLWLIEQLYGIEVAEQTKSYIAYDDPPRSTCSSC